MLECNNCFSRRLIKYINVDYKETYKCCGCGIVMDINQTIASKIESVMELSNDYWMSKEGKRYEFKDMSAEYLRNCIKLLKRTYTKKELRDSNLFIGLTQEYMLR